VLAVEVDTSLARRLASRAAPGAALSLVEADILKADLEALVQGDFLQGPGVRVVGNLPYAVASPVMLRLLARPDLFADWTMMAQKEVADRILAAPGSKLYGVLTLLCAAHAAATRILELSPSSFTPPPAVQSTLLHFTPQRTPFASPEAHADFEKVVKAAFSTRRKMLRNALAAGLRIAPELSEAVLRAGGINPEDRPERVPLQGYVELAARVRERGSLI
jgi:16S rRNA (adenine1518-N6/adenine1519-N6)-dimethyltransferase